MKKREDFAVSLRKKKTVEIISAKRRRIIESKCHNPTPSLDGETGTKLYNGGSLLEQNGEYETLLKEVCPQYLVDRSLGLVSTLKFGNFEISAFAEFPSNYE